MIKILVAVPTFETINPETFKSIYELEKTDDIELYFDFVKGYDCAIARNRIIEKTLNNGYDYVLMVDSDIIVPKNTITDLLSDNVPIVLGCYPRKSNPSKFELFKLGKPDFTDEQRFTVEEVLNNEDHLVPIKGGGFGCVLIKSSLLHKLTYPYFRYVIYESEKAFLSEDLYFCVKVLNQNISIYSDNRVICKHIKKSIVGA